MSEEFDTFGEVECDPEIDEDCDTGLPSASSFAGAHFAL